MNLFHKNIDDVRAEIANGDQTPSFCRIWLEKEHSFGLNTDEAAYAIGTMFEAGSGTTAAALMPFMLAMVHHPEWQRRLQQEIDAVVGNSRLPDFDDIPRLPTIRAIIKETLRWRPVTAGGVPHQLIKDDFYEGIFSRREQAFTQTSGRPIEIPLSIQTQRISVSSAGWSPLGRCTASL